MPRLVGRDAEVRRLTALLETSENAPHIVVLAGATGVGKSMLLNTVLDALHAQIVRAQAVVWEATWPLGVVAQLTPTVTATTEDAIQRLRLRISSSTFTVIVVEDAQWADIESLRALSSLARSLPAVALRAVFVRTDGTAGEPQLVSEFFARLSDSTIVVPRLDARATAELAASVGVSVRPLIAERLSTYTGGIARHVLALARELPPDVWTAATPELPAPRTIARSVAGALAEASASTLELVESVAVLGPSCTLADIVALSGLDDPLAIAEEAKFAGLIGIEGVEGTRRRLVMDPMVRRAVLECMGEAARSGAHQRAAEVLTDPATRLRHRAAALDSPNAALADELDEAASNSASRGNWAASAELLSLASGLTPEPELREERTLRTMDALVGSGDALAAAALVRDIDSMGETPLHHAVLGYLAIVQGKAAEAEGHLTRAWHLTDVYQDARVKAIIGQRYVLHSLAQCRATELVKWADRTVSLAPRDAPESLEARAIRGLGQSSLGQAEEALAAYKTLSEEGPRGAQSQRVVMARGWINLAIDEIDDARSELEAALPTDFLGGSLRISLWAHAWLARVHFLSGRWDDALDTAQRGLDLAARSGMTLVVPLLHWTVSQIHILRDEVAAAENSLRLGDARALDYSIMRIPAALAWATAAETRADYRGVVRVLAPFAAEAFGDMVDEPGYWPWADIYANALVMEGRHEEAESFLVPREKSARLRGHRSAIARLAYPRGRLLGARGDIGGARRCFEEALDLLADLPLDVDRARVNFAFGQTLRRAGRRRDAEVAIGEARQIFSAIGAVTYVGRCDRELNAPSAKTAAGQLASRLTVQERRVAHEVSRGRSNREIATELYISEKTVQYHLTRIFAKSGVTSRGQLASALGEDAAEASLGSSKIELPEI